MLVMYTLYQSISVSMPQTAYLKLIDVWLMFCLMLPFTIFLFQIVSEVLRAQREVKAWVEDETRRNYSGRKISQFTIPAFTVIFIICYCVVAALYYNYD
jgi:uncharacterized BrkB/YihY/UPF0761 family membrane protein